MQINQTAHSAPDSMKIRRILEHLTFIALAASSVNANASYSEQFIEPKQLTQDEAQVPHGKSTFRCGSPATHCRPARASANPASRTAALPGRVIAECVPAAGILLP
jgi:hypothetical protein